jgi:hypothetical protein
VGSDFEVRRGSAHRSWAAHIIGGWAGKLDSDSAARRSLVAVDEPWRGFASVGTSWWWRLGWRKAGGGGAHGGAHDSSGGGDLVEEAWAKG